MKELNVTPFEELDLLVKWLGNDSRQHAMSIRAANTQGPTRGFRKNLGEAGGCAEMVDNSLNKKLLGISCSFK